MKHNVNEWDIFLFVCPANEHKNVNNSLRLLFDLLIPTFFLTGFEKTLLVKPFILSTQTRGNNAGDSMFRSSATVTLKTGEEGVCFIIIII